MGNLREKQASAKLDAVPSGLLSPSPLKAKIATSITSSAPSQPPAKAREKYPLFSHPAFMAILKKNLTGPSWIMC